MEVEKGGKVIRRTEGGSVVVFRFVRMDGTASQCSNVLSS